MYGKYKVLLEKAGERPKCRPAPPGAMAATRLILQLFDGMRWAEYGMYDTARLDVDPNVDTRSIGDSGSVDHGLRSRPITLKDDHGELKSHVISDTLVEKVHDKRDPSYDLRSSRDRAN